jgi:hypothetical protein
VLRCLKVIDTFRVRPYLSMSNSVFARSKMGESIESFLAPHLIIILGLIPEIVKKCQFGFVLSRVGSWSKLTVNSIAPSLCLGRVYHEVAVLDVEETVVPG